MRQGNLTLGVCLAALVGLAPPVLAQEVQGPMAGSATEVDEVIVTARRRAERIQDVPSSISAISGEELEATGVTSLAVLQNRTPSLSMTTTGGNRDSLAFALRGQRTNETQLLTDAPVGTYFAEVVQPRNFGFGYTLFDLQSVQVLRGVQGSLFGRNVTGGAVLVEPQHPTDVFEGSIETTGGDYDLAQVTGVINVPLGETASVRLAARARSREGFTREVISGRDFDDQSFNALRASLIWRPTSQVESLFIYDRFQSDTNGTGGVLTQALPNGPVTAFYDPAFGMPDIQAAFTAQRGLGPRAFASEVGNGGPYDYFQRPRQETSTSGITNRTQVFLGDLTIRNIVGYRDVDSVNVFDLDGSPLALISADQDSFTHVFSEELQLLGTAMNDRLDYTFGVFYIREWGEDGARGVVEFPDLGVLAAGISPSEATQAAARVIDSSGTATSLAFYAAGALDLSETLNLSGGVRWTSDKREARVGPRRDSTSTCLFVFVDGSSPTYPDCSVHADDQWSAVTGDATLTWTASDDLNLYGAVRRGFRAGGFSLRAANPTELTPFNPEFVTEYEVGAKYQTTVNGQFLRLNGAVFYQDYTDVQKQVVRTIAGVTNTFIENTAEQENYGVEIEALWSPSERLDISAFYSFVESNVLAGANGDFDQIGVPRHQTGINASWTLPIAPELGEARLNLNASYRSSTNLDNRDLEGIEPGYSLVNVRIDWDNIAGSKVGASVFVDNLTDETYRIGSLSLVAETGFAKSIYGEPRMWGASLRYSF